MRPCSQGSAATALLEQYSEVVTHVMARRDALMAQCGEAGGAKPTTELLLEVDRCLLVYNWAALAFSIALFNKLLAPQQVGRGSSARLGAGPCVTPARPALLDCLGLLLCLADPAAHAIHSNLKPFAPCSPQAASLFVSSWPFMTTLLGVKRGLSAAGRAQGDG